MGSPLIKSGQDDVAAIPYFLKQAGQGYDISKTSNLGIVPMFCDYLEYNLKDNSSWAKMGRDVGRCRNVVKFMMTHATNDQKTFLLAKPPSTDKVGCAWMSWNNQLQDVSRSIAEVTMKALADEEMLVYGERQNKSNAGAKVTATISAVDGRLTRLKSAREDKTKILTTASYFTKTPSPDVNLLSSSSSSKSCSAFEEAQSSTPKKARYQI